MKCQTCGEDKNPDQFTTGLAMSNICDDCEFAMWQLYQEDVKARDCVSCNGSGNAFDNGLYFGKCPVCEGTGIKPDFNNG
jgi:hypothetical protein